jgi:hypothetical protein
VADNKAYFSIINVMKSNSVHKNNKMGICKVIIIGTLSYVRKTWTISKKLEMALGAIERKMLRIMYGRIRKMYSGESTIVIEIYFI